MLGGLRRSKPVNGTMPVLAGQETAEATRPTPSPGRCAACSMTSRDRYSPADSGGQAGRGERWPVVNGAIRRTDRSSAAAQLDAESSPVRSRRSSASGPWRTEVDGASPKLQRRSERTRRPRGRGLPGAPLVSRLDSSGPPAQQGPRPAIVHSRAPKLDLFSQVSGPQGF
jgi:hypothetical protein